MDINFCIQSKGFIGIQSFSWRKYTLESETLSIFSFTVLKIMAGQWSLTVITGLLTAKDYLDVPTFTNLIFLVFSPKQSLP